MFDAEDGSVVGLLPGERPEDIHGDADVAYEVTRQTLAEGWREDDRQVLPAGLEDWVPGPFLAVVVSAVDPSRLNGHDAVRLMRAQARLSAHHDAGKYQAMAEVAFSPPGDADSPVERDVCEVEFVEAEIGAALTLTRRASGTELARAISLSGRLSRVRDAYSEGLIDSHKVRVFDSQLGHLPEETVNAVLDKVLDDAAGLTTGQLRARVARLVLEADPDGSASSYEQGVAERKVATSSNPDLTANFGIYSARPDEVAAARDYVEHLARSLKTRGESRTLDQLRTDVALDLLQGKHPDLKGCWRGGGGRTHITVTAETLAGLADHPGDLEGYAPVFAEIARKTVSENVDGEWTFTVTDQGRPVATGTLARRPTDSQKRQVRAAYPTCVFPGCRQPSFVCDLDHRRPHSTGGPTHNDNLGPLCRHHHMMRHHGYWKLQRLESGDHQWTSPLGHTYLRKRGPPD